MSTSPAGGVSRLTTPHLATVTFANGFPNACSATVALLSPMVFATAKNGDAELSFTVGSAAMAFSTSMPCTTSPTTTLVRSNTAPAPRATVTAKAVPLGPGGGGSATLTNLPFTLTRRSFGGGGGAPRSTTKLTIPTLFPGKSSCPILRAASSGSSASLDAPPGRDVTGVVEPGMTKARIPVDPRNDGVSSFVSGSSSYSTASICVRR